MGLRLGAFVGDGEPALDRRRVLGVLEGHVGEREWIAARRLLLSTDSVGRRAPYQQRVWGIDRESATGSDVVAEAPTLGAEGLLVE